MKRYLALAFIGILLLTACSKDQSGEVSPAASDETETETSTTPSSSGPSVVEVQTSIFQKAVAERDPEQCKKIEDKSQSENCISIVETLNKQDEASASAQ